MKRIHPDMKTILLTFVFAIFALAAFANTYTVTRTADDNSSGSLRWAITQANSNSGYDIINFNINPLNLSNTFEISGLNSWAVITLGSALPVITETVLIDGTTQLNTNTGSMAGKTVGADGLTQPAINYPDVYIVCGYTLPNDDSGTGGNGLSVNGTNVTIRGLAISGFGNRSNAQPTGIAHADISILRPSSARNINVVITGCFLSCNPRGAAPSTAARTSKASSILVCGYNNRGTINANYMSHAGGYGVVFHATHNNGLSGTNQTLRACQNWNIYDNQVIDIGNSTVYTSGNGRAADGISLMNTYFCYVRNNYIEDFEQFGIDLGHNTDDNRVENNTVTGMVKTNGSAPLGGIRIGFSSERDTLYRNRVFNNNIAGFLGGIYMDESQTSFSGGTVKNNRYYYLSQNQIHNNTGSGMVLSTNGAGSLTFVNMTENSTYNNTGLGIDLNYNLLVGPTAVSVNDNNDVDNGTNNIQNFPIIDSVSVVGTSIYIWGKGPAGSTMEFFLPDGGINKHGGLALNYGEGRTFIGRGVEGSVQDGVAGTDSYSIDGNIANPGTVNRFCFLFSYSGPVTAVDSITSTATVFSGLNGNTSEFGPKSIIGVALGVYLKNISAVLTDNKVKVYWDAVCDDKFGHFEVEHSINGTNFSKTGQNVYTNSINSLNTFDFIHNNPGSGSNFYRLKMINTDGTVKYSNVVRVVINDAKMGELIKVFNNPFRDKIALQVEVKHENAPVTMSLYDPSGKYVKGLNLQAKKGTNFLQIDNLSSYSSGIYILDAEIGGERKTIKLVKQ